MQKMNSCDYGLNSCNMHAGILVFLNLTGVNSQSILDKMGGVIFEPILEPFLAKCEFKIGTVLLDVTDGVSQEQTRRQIEKGLKR